MSKTYLQYSGCGGHLGFPIDMILAYFDSEVVFCYRASFGSNRPKGLEEMSKIDYQDGGCGDRL